MVHISQITPKIFREINFLVTSLVKTLIWRENVEFSVKTVIVFLTTFTHTLITIYAALHCFHEIFLKRKKSENFTKKSMKSTYVQINHSVN